MAEEKSVKAKAVEWMLGQPFNNVLLFSILAAIAWTGHYCVTVAIPAHLKIIQEGYEKIEESHRNERVETMKIYDRWLGLKRDPSIDSKIAAQEE